MYLLLSRGDYALHCGGPFDCNSTSISYSLSLAVGSRAVIVLLYKFMFGDCSTALWLQLNHDYYRQSVSTYSWP